MKPSFVFLFPLLFLAGCEQIKKLKVESAKAAPSAPAVAPSTAQLAPAGPLVRELEESEFESFAAIPGRVVLVDFTATWCGPCRMLGPRLEAIAQKHGGRVLLGKVDIDRNGELARRMGVGGIPDVRIYVNGAEVDRFVGALDEASIEAKIAPGLAKVPAAAEASAESPAAAPSPAEPAIQPMKKDWMPEGMQRR
ncbi:MAG: thioredoxin family protein [Akkermansiaceae bacterium]|jgi:thioredoxin|nr:thioredoxin family protein [Akkermansiaceae bacterium]